MCQCNIVTDYISTCTYIDSIVYIIKDLDGKVEYWMTRYGEDLEMKTIDVQEIKTVYNNLTLDTICL